SVVDVVGKAHEHSQICISYTEPSSGLRLNPDSDSTGPVRSVRLDRGNLKGRCLFPLPLHRSTHRRDGHYRRNPHPHPLINVAHSNPFASGSHSTPNSHNPALR